MSDKPISVGIDLGTTFSAIAWVNEHGKAEVLPNAENDRITPSVVLFENDRVIVGREAKQCAVAEPEKVVEFIKREMGKAKDECFFQFNGVEYTPESISALILKKVKMDAEQQLGRKIDRAVITVPAYFNDAQRSATIAAGRIAGVQVMRILNEPVAAALAYGLSRIDTDQTVFVADLGGGTFDVSVMRIEKKEIRMLAINGDHYLGGKDWDDALITYIAGKFQEAYGLDPLDDPSAYQDIQLRAVQAKHSLSQREAAKIVVNHGGNTLKLEITAEFFNELTRPLVDRVRALCEICMDEAKLKWSQIDTVLLAGGATRMPSIRTLARDLSGKEPCADINPDEAIALGAAYQASLIDTEAGLDVAKINCTGVHTINPHTLGIVILDEERRERVFPMIVKGSPLPVEKHDRFGTADDNQTTVIVKIVEGEDEDPAACNTLGELRLDDLPMRPKGAPIEICYRYNENSVLEVEAKDMESGHAAKSELKRAGALSESEIVAAQAHLAKLVIE